MKLSTKARKALPKSAYAMPGEKKYPITDKAHAANAKARATQQFNKDNLSASGRAAVNRKANKMLGKGSGKKK